MAGTVFVVDDDEGVRRSLTLMLGLGGYGTSAYSSAAEFLNACKPGAAGCILADVRMPEMDGLALQQALKDRNIDMPIIFMTAYGDVRTTRAAFKAGAVDFLEKPVDENLLLNLVNEALGKNSELQEAAARKSAASQKLSLLTSREQQILDHVVDGKHNREIAAELSISSRTVEVHKARLMAKLGVTRIAELTKFIMAAK